MERRILLLFAILFFASYSNAQTYLDSMLVNIETGEKNVPSGIIYERVIQLSNLYNFNESKEYNTANSKFFYQAFNELRKASNNKKFMDLASLKKRVASAKQGDNLVEVAIMNTSFEILNYREKEPKEGGLLLDEKTGLFSPIKGQPSFYTLQTTFVAPTKKILEGTSVNFTFPKDLYFSNTGKQIKELSIDFGAGKTVTVIGDGKFKTQSLEISYESSGEKSFSCQVTYDDEEVVNTNGSFYFHYTANNGGAENGNDCLDDRTLDYSMNAVGEEPFQGYLPGDPSIRAEIDYRIYYADAQYHSDLKVYKPIIIIDGFDPGDLRKIEDCDCEADASCASEFLTDGQFDPEKHIAVLDKMNYKDGENTVELLDTLRAQGYDVIVVNHPTYNAIDINTGTYVTIDGGAYYIESNAIALVALIKRMNSELTLNGSSEEIAIIGPSMGGQTSRYALAYMEKKYAETGNPIWKHNTYLWISVDSPHLGANIPLGDQSLIYLLADVEGEDNALDSYNNRLGNPAARQQLIEFHRDVPSRNYVNLENLNGRVAAQGYPTDEGSDFFRTYYNAQESNGLPGSSGYPQNLRKVSLVNGSMTGSKQTDLGFDFAGDEASVMEVAGFVTVCIRTWLGKICFDVRLARLNARFMSQPFSGESQMAFFQKFEFFQNSQHHFVNAPNLNSRGNMDNVPGGYFDAQKDILESVFESGPLPAPFNGPNNTTYQVGPFNLRDYWEIRNYSPVHSFIPSFSSIAHTSPNQDWANPLDYNLLCADDTHFDSYFGDEFNSEHTSFTKESAEWLFKELAGEEQLPYYPLDDNDLKGPTALCIGEVATYIFGACKLPATPEWEVSHKLEILSINNDNNSITVRALEDGLVFVHADVEGQPEPFNKLIYVGPPVVQGVQEVAVDPDSGNNDNSPFSSGLSCDRIALQVKFLAEYKLAEEIEWERISNNFTFDETDQLWPNTDFNEDQYAIVNPQCNGVIKFRIRARNACGWSEWETLQYQVTTCLNNCQGSPLNPGGGQGSQLDTDNFSIYPVPADDFLTVNVHVAANDIQFAGPVLTVDIYSNTGGFGALVKSASSATLPVTIDVSDLPIGVYTVVISFNGVTETHQININ